MFNFPDAPTEGQLFSPPGGPQYKFVSPVWQALYPDPTQPIPVPEAPNDSQVYGRMNATWVVLASGTGDNTPPGTVIWTARTTPPTGYLKANGAAVSRTTYATLFTAIGTTYGAGDGSTTFTLPDLRGEFIRGFDDGRGVDAGRSQGAAQAETIKAHIHPFTGDALPTHNHTASAAAETTDHTHTFSDSSSSTSSAGAHTHTFTDNYNTTGTMVVGGSVNIAGVATSVSDSTGSAGAHTHTVAVSGTTSGRSASHTHVITNVAITAGTPTGTIGNNTGSPAETRPRNVSLLACIKF